MLDRHRGLLGAQMAIALPWVSATEAQAVSPFSAARRRAGGRRPRPLRPLAYAVLGVGLGTLPAQPGRGAGGDLRLVRGRRERARRARAPDVSRFLPGGLFSGTDTDGVRLLPLAAAVPLVVAWVIAISVFALRTTLRRDIA